MIRFYYYQHPNTEKIYSEQRMDGFENKPYISPDGKKCKILKDYNPFSNEHKSTFGIINKNAECFEKDPAFVKKCRPKFVRYNDGHREKYDSTRHN